MANPAATTGRAGSTSLSARAMHRCPLGGVLLIVAGALLILLEGLYVALSGVTVGYSPSFTPPASASVVGWLSVLAGVVGAGLGALIYVRANLHILVGAASLTVALLGLYGGGGFLLGSMLLYVGGLVALYFEPVSVSLSPSDLPDDVLDDDPVIEADMIASGTRSR